MCRLERGGAAAAAISGQKINETNGTNIPMRLDGEHALASCVRCCNYVEQRFIAISDGSILRLSDTVSAATLA